VCRHTPHIHVNNLGWAAVIESIVLGDGGPSHVRTLTILLNAGADPNIPNDNGQTLLALARGHGYPEMIVLLKAAGSQ